MSADKNVTIRISLDEMAERVKASPEFAELAVLIKDREQRIGEIHAEKVAAEARASSLSRELLDAMQARDSYRASAEHRVGMRREFEELLGCGDTMGNEAFERGLARLRELAEAESRAERLEEALRESQETLALVLWAHPKGRVTVSDHHRATLPIPWEIVTYLDVDTRATVIGVRAAEREERGKEKGEV